MQLPRTCAGSLNYVRHQSGFVWNPYPLSHATGHPVQRSFSQVPWYCRKPFDGESVIAPEHCLRRGNAETGDVTSVCKFLPSLSLHEEGHSLVLKSGQIHLVPFHGPLRDLSDLLCLGEESSLGQSCFSRRRQLRSLRNRLRSNVNRHRFFFGRGCGWGSRTQTFLLHPYSGSGGPVLGCFYRSRPGSHLTGLAKIFRRHAIESCQPAFGRQRIHRIKPCHRQAFRARREEPRDTLRTAWGKT